MRAKKYTSLVLAAIMSVSLVACGSNVQTEAESKGEVQTESSQTETEVETKLSKEEMISQAEEVKASEMNNDCISNVVKANQTYCDKTVKIVAYVDSIEPDHAVLKCSKEASGFVFDAYMSTDDLVQLEQGTNIIVVGHVSIIDKREVQQLGMTYEETFCTFDNAYFVENLGLPRVQVTGVIQTAGIKINGESKIYGVKFADGINKDDYMWQEVTIDAVKVKSNQGIITYEDAKIVE